ncbi:MAG TPA: LytR C-terminal domain-containing protein [Acidimicrobiia bacterium]
MATTVPGVPRHAGRSLVRSAARGAGLIAAAVIVGIVLLQVIDDGGGPSGNGGNGNGTTIDTTTDDTTTDTTAGGEARPPAEVVVQVLNAGGATGAAGTLTNQLVGAGYSTLPAADDPVARTDTVVTCKEGYEAEAAALLLTVQGAGYPAATNVPFPTDRTDLPGVAEANCLVLIGQA